MKLLEKNATGCHLPSGPCWERTAPEAKSELSASSRYIRDSSGRMRTRSEVTASLRARNAAASFSVQTHTLPFVVRLKRGRAVVRDVADEPPVEVCETDELLHI